MNGNYALNLYIEKNNRVYMFCVPVNSPYEEANQVALEFAQGVLDLQKQALENAEKQKLEEEAKNAVQEAKND